MRGSHLLAGDSRSCGCLGREVTSKRSIGNHFAVGRRAQAIEDLTGRTFSKWVVLGRAPNRKSHVRWWCRCKCSRQTMRAVHQSLLTSGLSRGCCGRAVHDLTGRWFGWWYVLGLAPRLRRYTRWACRCFACPARPCRMVFASNLISDHSRSCCGSSNQYRTVRALPSPHQMRILQNEIIHQPSLRSLRGKELWTAISRWFQNLRAADKAAPGIPGTAKEKPAQSVVLPVHEKSKACQHIDARRAASRRGRRY